MNSNSQLLSRAVEAAHAAGKILVSDQASFGVIGNAGKDLKSEADLAAEKAIFSILDPCGIPTLSEESRSKTDIFHSGKAWIVDPLDGTLNYTRGLPMFCVSIGLWENGRPTFGVIHEPLAGRTFVGHVGHGATLNERPITTAAVADPAQAILCTGFPTGRSYESEGLHRFVQSVQRFKKVRLLGSAALSLAYLSAGCVDAYYEQDIWLWDVAAGLAIVAAAGGQVSFGPWSTELKSSVIATNGQLSVGELQK